MMMLFVVSTLATGVSAARISLQYANAASNDNIGCTWLKHFVSNVVQTLY